MTYTKLIESLRELADRECYPDDKMLTDAANALEKNYAELDNQSMQLAHDAVTIECLNDKVMAMQAKLDELTKQEPVIDFTVLHQFASDQAISYNKLCTAVRMCLAAPKALAPLTDERKYKLLDHGDEIKKGDTVLDDDATTWHPLAGWEVGMKWGGNLMPMRRAIESLKEPTP